jgi:hypothetical protein
MSAMFTSCQGVKALVGVGCVSSEWDIGDVDGDLPPLNTSVCRAQAFCIVVLMYDSRCHLGLTSADCIMRVLMRSQLQPVQKARCCANAASALLAS